MSDHKSSKLFVANLSSKVTESDLRDLFDKYGAIQEVSIREKGDRYAFVDFEEARDAETAYDRVNGYELLGKKLRIEFSHGKGGSRAPKNDNPCYICGRRGHWARECPDGSGVSASERKCFKCGSSSHKIWNCPKKRCACEVLNSLASQRARGKKEAEARAKRLLGAKQRKGGKEACRRERLEARKEGASRRRKAGREKGKRKRRGKKVR